MSEQEDTRHAMRSLVAHMGLTQQREEQLHARIEELLRMLNDGVQRAGQDVNRVVEDALPRLTQLSRQALDSTLTPAAQRFARDVEHADVALTQATGRYASAQQALESRVMRRVHLAAAGLCVAAIVALASGGWLLYSASSEVAKLRQEFDYLAAIQRSDVVPCGKDRLCARIAEKGERYGQAKEYRQIELRR